MMDVMKRTNGQRQLVFTPRADVVETAEGVIVTLEMPGVRAEDLDIHFDRGELTVQGKCSPANPVKGNWLVREYEVGDFYRAFQVSQDIDGSAIRAELKNGLLTLHLPKSEGAKPRRISVQSK